MSLEPADQTRGDSTPFLDVTGPVTLSRNEVSALCLKAARGTGMSWGLAEEAGYAAAWLTGHGIDGLRYLLAHLTEAQRRKWAELCPTVAAGEWHAAPGRSLCPMALGATLCDYKRLPEGPANGCSIRVGPVDHPILLIPFLAEVAEQASMTLRLDWEGGEVAVGGAGTWPRRAAGNSGSSSSPVLPPARRCRH